MSEDILKEGHIEGYEFSENQKNFWKIGNGDLNRFYSEMLLKVKVSVTGQEVREAIEAVTGFHEVLTFRVSDNDKYAFPIQYSGAGADIRTIPLQDGCKAEALVTDCLDRSYNPLSDAPVRFCLVMDGEAVSYLGIRLYALWGDAYSCASLARELSRALVTGNACPDEQTEHIDYAKYCAWQNDLIKAPEEEAVHFWEQYDAFPFERVLPFAASRIQGYSSTRRLIHTFEKESYHLLTTFCATHNVTAEDVLLAAFGRYLSVFADHPVTIGYLSQRRRYEELDDTIGLVNTIWPLKLDPHTSGSASDYIRYVKSERERVADWADYFTVNRDGAQDPYQTIFRQVFEFHAIGTVGDHFEPEDFYTIQEPVELKLSCTDYGDRVSIELYFLEAVYPAETIAVVEEQLGGYFNSIGNLLDEDGGFKPKASRLEETIIADAHAALAGVRAEATVIAMFEQQVSRSPEAIALTGEGLLMTYGELDRKATLLKNYLLGTCGVQKGEAICYLGGASSWFVVSTLAILKAGAFYIPVDHNYPTERIRHILEDSGCRLLLCEDNIAIIPDIPGVTVFYLCRQETWPDSTEAPSVAAGMDDTAYCIFTSGSSGRPKGCAISHAGLANYITWANHFYFSNRESGNCALISSISFDLTVTALFSSLTRGKKLWIGKEGVDMGAILKEVLTNSDIDTLKLTPSHVALIGALDIQQPGLKTVICGGEQLLQHHIDILYAVNANLAIYNEYGPTEATVGCVVKEMSKEQGRILIGKPISNMRILISDETREGCLIGVSGEMYIGGAGVAKGYLNRPDLNKVSFIADPLIPGGQLYKTGDLARWLPDGNIEYLGRKDNQLKIRGYRIEPEDIACQLQQHDDIDEVVILGKEAEPGQKEIVAYYVSGKRNDPEVFKAFLQDKLPAYMLPAFYIQMRSMPLTPNGKADHRALLAIDLPGLENGDIEYLAPRNELELRLCNIWEQVLGKKKIGVRNNFFSLGGHSIKATRLINEYQKHFGVRLALKAVFEQVTPEAHAALIRTSKYAPGQIRKAPPAAHYPLSAAQKRMWVLSQFRGASPAYNIPTSVYIADCDIALFRQAVDAVIDRHEILRTVFKEDETGEIRQWVKDRTTLGISIGSMDCRHMAGAKQTVAAFIKEDMFRSFDLENGPLIRGMLFQVTDKDYIFYYNMHHIVSDGWSMNVMERDVMAFYEAYRHGQDSLPPLLELQYKDYACWEHAAMRQEGLDREKEFWLQTLSPELPVLDLSASVIRPKVKTYNGRYLYTYLEPSFLKESRDFVEIHGGSMFMLLLTTWNILLYKYTQCRDLIVGTPVAGRGHAELENQIGFYVNMLALRNRIDPEVTVTQCYTEVVSNTLDAFDHQAYPFDLLVQDLTLERDTARDPVFGIMFALQNNEDLQADLVAPDEVTDEIRDNGTHLAKFELSVNFKETAAGLYFNITYNEDIYDKGFVERLMRHFRQLFRLVTISPATAIKELDLLGSSDRDMLMKFSGLQAVKTVPAGSTLVNLFKDQVNKKKDALAIVYEEETMSYRELYQVAGHIAYILHHDFGIDKGDMVGVQLGRNQWSVAAFLGILMAGAAYVPLDPAIPRSRKAFIIEDTGLTMFLTDAMPDQHSFYTGDTLYIDDVFKRAVKDSIWECTALEPQDLAYIIYTSGTTGQPKGVMIEHAGVVNTMLSHIDRVGMSAYHSCLQCSSFAFDASVTEIFSTLLSGATLHIVSEQRRNDVALFEQYLVDNNIDVALLTPAYLKLLNPDNLATLKVLITAGEAAVADKVAAYLCYGTFYNAYGPTEASICATIYKVDKNTQIQSSQIPIGYPIDNVAVYILDEYGQLMPPGAVGEIVVGGKGVARGYLNRPLLNKEKFIDSPFGQAGKLYKTGDLGRWLPDGSLEYAGRADSQVKIHGHRVELQEIEFRLQQHPDVSEAAVLVVNGELTAFITGGRLLDVASLRNFLKQELPDYMLPGQYHQVDAIPLTVNGKSDRRALLEATQTRLRSGTNYQAPETDIEIELVKIWESVLERSPIGVLDSFFLIGGDSIKGIRIFTEMKKAFSVKLDLAVIFQKNTIKELGTYISNMAVLNDIMSSGPDTEVVDQIII